MSIPRNDVSVWLAILDQPQSIIHQLLQTLSPDERQRASRFRIEKDRDHFIASHGFLRAILGHFLDIRASELRFSYGGKGKPVLGEAMGQPQVHFSLSRSHGMCLYAVAWKRTVGIDLELIRPIPEKNDIAQATFSNRDVDIFLSAPPQRRQEIFFKCWTRKEAYLKGIGEGLGGSLGQVDVLGDLDEPSVVVSTSRDVPEKVEWHLQDLRPAQRYVGALAVEGWGGS